MARELQLNEAEEFLKQFEADSERMAEEGLRDAIAHMKEGGFRVVACGIPVGSGRPAKNLEATLASHPALHTAEGELFRQVIVRAGEKLRLPVLQVREREIYEVAAPDLGFKRAELNLMLQELGKTLGPPWGQDQKLAALAAWLALANPVGSRQRHDFH